MNDGNLRLHHLSRGRSEGADNLPLSYGYSLCVEATSWRRLLCERLIQLLHSDHLSLITASGFHPAFCFRRPPRGQLGLSQNTEQCVSKGCSFVGPRFEYRLPWLNV